MSLGRVFVDTGAWFALQVTDDSYHRVSRDTFPVLVEACQSLVTSNLVVGETYTLLRLSTRYREAKRFLPPGSSGSRSTFAFHPELE